MLTTTTFPEIVDSVENRHDYSEYNKESMNLHISSVFVLISAVAQLIGVFFGSTFAGLWGYNIAFVLAGLALISFAIVYAFVCGLGDNFYPNVPNPQIPNLEVSTTKRGDCEILMTETSN